MGKGRLEAFSDGVIAVIITIMVLELKVPHGTSLADLSELAPVFLTYVLSFTNVGIYWVNHHHLLHMVKKVSGGILWANLHLLFWLSLIPFTTGWMGENHFSTWPVVIYGIDLLACALAYTLLAQTIARSRDRDSEIEKLIQFSTKDKISLVSYVISIPMAFYYPWISGALFVAVALMWFLPDRRIEGALQ
jgi:uncharacterized membrane protein